MAEAAGLALAVFPLCIELIKYYCAGIATLRDMREHHHLLKEFDRELNMEYCKYKTSLASVFDGTVTAATIFEDPAAAKARLEDRLPFPDVVENFIKAVERMRDEVKELQMKFEIDRDTSGKINQQRIRKNLKKRFKLAVLKDEYTNRIRHIRDLNADINMILNGAKTSLSLESPNTPQHRIRTIQKHYKRVQESAKSVFDALKSQIQAPHACGDGGHRLGMCLDKHIGSGGTGLVPGLSGIAGSGNVDSLEHRSIPKNDGKLSFSIFVNLTGKSPVDADDQLRAVMPGGWEAEPESVPGSISIWRELAIDDDRGYFQDQIEEVMQEEVDRQAARPFGGSRGGSRVSFADNIDIKENVNGTKTRQLWGTCHHTGPSPALTESSREPQSEKRGILVGKKTNMVMGRSSQGSGNGADTDGGVMRLKGKQQTEQLSETRRSTLVVESMSSIVRKLGFKSSDPNTHPRTSADMIKPPNSPPAHQHFNTFLAPATLIAAAVIVDSAIPNLFAGTDTLAPTEQPSLPECSTQFEAASADTLELASEPAADPDIESESMQDICLKLQEYVSNRRYLGMLNPPIEGSCAKYKVSSMPLGWCLNMPSTPGSGDLNWSPEPVSLQILLECIRGDPYNLTLTRKDRLLIGIKLASSVMQLHNTWWLSGSWSKKDIIFFSNPRTNKLLIEKPIVLHNVANNNSDMETGSPGTFQSIKSRPLFLLGLVLWELWYGRCFEERFQPSATEKNKSRLTGDYLQWQDDALLVLAHKALEEMSLDGHALPRYTEAVRACIFGGIKLTNEEFTTAWEKVVWPLEKVYESCFS